MLAITAAGWISKSFMCRLSGKLMVDDAFWIHSQCTETDEVIGILITRKGF